MRIVINTAQQRFGGAVQVALSFIHECIHFPEHEYHVWLGIGVGNTIDTGIFPPNFYFYQFHFGPIDFREIRKIQKTLRVFELTIKPDIIFATSGPTYYHSIAPQIIGYNLPLYIYPESPFIVDLPLSKRLKYWIRKQFHFYYFKRDAVAYVTQTDDVRERVIKALNTKKVYTITNNHNHFFSLPIPIDNSILPVRENNEYRFLTLTSYYPHKNLELISEIVKILIQKEIFNVRFIVTLKDEDYMRCFRNCNFVINTGIIKPSDCPKLYSECDAMFLPTLAECFSASYPEAMVMRKPILTSDLAFARSICSNAALYFRPKDPVDAFDMINKLINDIELSNTLVNNGIKQLKNFDSARIRAKKYLDLCKNFKLAEFN